MSIELEDLVREAELFAGECLTPAGSDSERDQRIRTLAKGQAALLREFMALRDRLSAR